MQERWELQERYESQGWCEPCAGAVDLWWSANFDKLGTLSTRPYDSPKLHRTHKHSFLGINVKQLECVCASAQSTGTCSHA